MSTSDIPHKSVMAKHFFLSFMVIKRQTQLWNIQVEREKSWPSNVKPNYETYKL